MRPISSPDATCPKENAGSAALPRADRPATFHADRGGERPNGFNMGPASPTSASGSCAGPRSPSDDGFDDEAGTQRHIVIRMPAAVGPLGEPAALVVGDPASRTGAGRLAVHPGACGLLPDPPGEAPGGRCRALRHAGAGDGKASCAQIGTIAPKSAASFTANKSTRPTRPCRVAATRIPARRVLPQPARDGQLDA